MIVSLIPIEREYCDTIEKQTGERVLSYRNAGEALEVLPEAEIILSWGELGEDIVKACKKLKWLFVMSAGVEKLAFDELDRKGVIVTNVSGIHGPQMAEHAFGLIILFSRQLNRSIRSQLQKKWERIKSMGELTGKTLCIVGSGSIGKEIARKAKAFDMRVIGLKKHAEALENFDRVWGMEKLHDALGQADYTVLLTPLTDETYHLLGMNEFLAMKPTSVFINLSRGDTVDETALIEALQKGIIAGAGLDVFHQEPLPEHSPFWEMENVVITPHNAGQSPHYIPRAIELFLSSFDCYRQGKSMPNQIDLKMKY